MVAKLNSSSVLQTEGQVMAERPKNNCFFAAPNHPGNEKLRLFETVCSVQNSYKEYLHDLLTVCPRKHGSRQSPLTLHRLTLTTVPPHQRRISVYTASLKTLGINISDIRKEWQRKTVPCNFSL